MARTWRQGLVVSLLAHALVLSGGWLWALLRHPEPPAPQPIQARLVAPEPPQEPAPAPETPEPPPEPATAEAQPSEAESKPAPASPADPAPQAPKAPAEPTPKKRIAEPEPEPEPEPILGQGLADKISKLAEDSEDQGGSLRQRQAVARFQEAVRSRVQANWLVPPGLEERGELTATVRIALTPAGELAAEPRVVASNGPGHFSSSVVRAVKKAAPFPMPDGPTEYFRNLELHFSPDMVR